jgi:hypothetical protein
MRGGSSTSMSAELPRADCWGRLASTDENAPTAAARQNLSTLGNGDSSLMHTWSSPEFVIQRQLDTYNAKDLDAWLSTYAKDAKQYEHPGKLLASGRAEIRARAGPRFSEPNLHATLIKRTVMGNIVIDHEDVTRTFAEGPGNIELVCIYVVERGLIQTASFIFGQQVLAKHSQ